MSRTTRAGTKLPRVPLPNRVEKVHEKKSKDRKVKHKKKIVRDTSVAFHDVPPKGSIYDMDDFGDM